MRDLKDTETRSSNTINTGLSKKNESKFYQQFEVEFTKT